MHPSTIDCTGSEQISARYTPKSLVSASIA
jgi:hypothetical protein